MVQNKTGTKTKYRKTEQSNNVKYVLLQTLATICPPQAEKKRGSGWRESTFLSSLGCTKTEFS